MKFLDRNDPFFAKPWVRAITVGFPLVWGLVEFWFDSPGWGILFLAAGAYAGWELYIRTAD